MFDSGVVEFDAKVASADAMLEAAIEAGADDVVSSESGHESMLQATFADVAKALEAKFGEPARPRWCGSRRTPSRSTTTRAKSSSS